MWMTKKQVWNFQKPIKVFLKSRQKYHRKCLGNSWKASRNNLKNHMWHTQNTGKKMFIESSWEIHTKQAENPMGACPERTWGDFIQSSWGLLDKKEEIFFSKICFCHSISLLRLRRYVLFKRQESSWPYKHFSYCPHSLWVNGQVSSADLLGRGIW